MTVQEYNGKMEAILAQLQDLIEDAEYIDFDMHNATSLDMALDMLADNDDVDVDNLPPEEIERIRRICDYNADTKNRIDAVRDALDNIRDRFPCVSDF